MKSEYITSLFLSDSYKEQLENYNKVLKKEYSFLWDVVVITASNEKQAKIYEKQINKRLTNNLLPLDCDFLVIPDKDNKRIGSGGATLNVFKILKDKYENFDELKVLLIHSGGDSKRIPQYSMGGKLFSPVPRELSPFFTSTLFDELLIMFCSVPLRMNPGILTICGDALLLFNPLQLDMEYKDLSSITMKAPLQQGTHHGVLVESNGLVDKFLHKCSIDSLKEENAVYNDMVNIDTGIIYFSAKVVNKFLSIINDNFDILTNDETRLNLYGDMLYPFATSSTLNEYLKQPAENEINDNLIKARNLIWELRENIEYSIIKLSPAKFIHFGTSHELFDLMVNNIENYESIGWKRCINATNIKNNVCLINSIVNGSKINNSFVENSIIEDSIIGDNTIISNTNIIGKDIPDNICLSTTKIKEGFVTRIYGINDDPKKKLSDGIMGFDISKVNEKYNLKIDINKTLWETELYCVSKSDTQSVSNALTLYRILSLDATNKEATKWLVSQRKSLASSFNESLIQDSNTLMLDVVEDYIINSIYARKNLKSVSKILSDSIYKDKIINRINSKIDTYNNYIKTRMYYIMSEVSGDKDKSLMLFKTIKEMVSQNYFKENVDFLVKENIVDIYLPIRLNFGGGWSDTPPYCLENGGTVLNASVKLNGKLPIHVKIEKLAEKKLVLESLDLGKSNKINTSREIYNCSDPNDAFALVKSAIVISGMVASNDYDLAKLYENVNGGVKIITDVQNIPRGSGLGTSSILSGALMMALYKFMGIDKSLKDISDDVLKLEQLMSTGGGWQDQVGGIFPGIKLITSKADCEQKLNIKTLKLTSEFINNFNNRFILINTGQRRLARNLLRNIVIKYVSNDETTLKVLKDIQHIAKKQATSLEKNDINEFGNLLDKHWNMIKQMDPGCTNLCIDTIIKTIEDDICGKTICGAGGGGFILAILKESVTKQDIKDKLENIFADTDVQLYDIELV